MAKVKPELPAELVKGMAHACTVRETLDAVPDGWAKIDGEWIRLRPRTPDNSAGRRLFEEA